MINPPKTLEEAQQTKYGTSRDMGFVPRFCAYRIKRYDYQCLHYPGHGPANLYCKTHARIVEGAKE